MWQHKKQRRHPSFMHEKVSKFFFCCDIFIFCPIRRHFDIVAYSSEILCYNAHWAQAWLEIVSYHKKILPPKNFEYVIFWSTILMFIGLLFASITKTSLQRQSLSKSECASCENKNPKSICASKHLDRWQSNFRQPLWRATINNIPFYQRTEKKKTFYYYGVSLSHELK